MMLSWRLKDLPSVAEVESLIKSSVITKEEARSIFFKEIDGKVESSELQEIKDELAVIRKIVTSLPGSSIVVREVREAIPRHGGYPWTSPYITWCSTGNN